MVALKVMLSKMPDPQEAERFLREAQSLAQIQHVHVVRVRDFGQHQDQAYFTMDLNEGKPLRAHIDEPLKEHKRITDLSWLFEKHLALLEALIFCHQRGLVHRDLKPVNVLIEEGSERPVLVDFGLVKLDRKRVQRLDDGSVSFSSCVFQSSFRDPKKDFEVVVRGGHLELNHCLIRGAGTGLSISGECSVTARHCLFQGAHFAGVYIQFGSKRNIFEDCLFQGNGEALKDGRNGRDINIRDGSEAIIRGSLFQSHCDANIVIEEGDSVTRIEDNLSKQADSKTEPENKGREESVVKLSTGDTQSMIRGCVIVGPKLNGVLIESSSRVSMEDCQVRGFKNGVKVKQQGRLKMTRCQVRDNGRCSASTRPSRAALRITKTDTIGLKMSIPK